MFELPAVDATRPKWAPDNLCVKPVLVIDTKRLRPAVELDTDTVDRGPARQASRSTHRQCWTDPS